MASCGEISRCDSLDSLFKDLSRNINVVSQQIKGGESTREPSGDSFSSEQYWNTVDGIFKKLSTETTKLSLAFSKKPFPSTNNADAMVTEIEKAMLSLTSIFYTLPLNQGNALRKSFKNTVTNVLESLHSFSLALLDCVISASNNQRLLWTGGVWQATDFHILKDNRSCVLKELTSTGELVNDALGEIEEAKETDGLMETMFFEDDGKEEDGEGQEEGATWSEQDKRVIEACAGLVKATKTVVKKSRECVHKTGSGSGGEDDAGVVSVQDAVVELTRQVSPRVDQFVCGIYAPVHYSEMKENGRHLADLIEQILQFLSSSPLTDNSDQSWLDFLQSAVTHNLDKLRKSTLPDQGHG